MRYPRIVPIIVAAAGLTACGHPTDAALVRTFADHRPAFEQIIRMATEDRHLTRVAPDFTWLKDDLSWPRANIGLTAERWGRYRELFRETGVHEGFLRVGDGEIQLLASAKGLATGGSTKGYAYSQGRVTPVFQTLDPPPPVKSNETGYRHIDGPWYLFYEWDD